MSPACAQPIFYCNGKKRVSVDNYRQTCSNILWVLGPLNHRHVLSACHSPPPPPPFSPTISGTVCRPRTFTMRQFTLNVEHNLIWQKSCLRAIIVPIIIAPPRFGGGSEPSSACIPLSSQHCPLPAAHTIPPRRSRPFTVIIEMPLPYIAGKCNAFHKNICISFAAHRNQFGSKGVGDGDGKRISFKDIWKYRQLCGQAEQCLSPVAFCHAINV